MNHSSEQIWMSLIINLIKSIYMEFTMPKNFFKTIMEKSTNIKIDFLLSSDTQPKSKLETKYEKK